MVGQSLASPQNPSQALPARGFSRHANHETTETHESTDNVHIRRRFKLKFELEQTNSLRTDPEGGVIRS